MEPSSNCGLLNRETVNNWRLWTFPHTPTPYKVSACWIHLIVGETNHGPRLLWNLSWRNKAEKVNFNCHELMRLWMPSVHWWQPTGVNSMQAPSLFCASHTFCIVFRVGRWMHENDDIFLSGPEFFLIFVHLSPFLRPMSDFQFHPVHSESFVWGLKGLSHFENIVPYDYSTSRTHKFTKMAITHMLLNLCKDDRGQVKSYISIKDVFLKKYNIINYRKI